MPSAGTHNLLEKRSDSLHANEAFWLAIICGKLSVISDGKPRRFDGYQLERHSSLLLLFPWVVCRRIETCDPAAPVALGPDAPSFWKRANGEQAAPTLGPPCW
jgi:hypothetical protein